MSTEHGNDFMSQIRDVAKKAGAEVVEKALIAYEVMTDDSTPAGARATLLGALVYLGLPLDLVPDYLIGVGWGDDLAALAAALTAVAACLRQEHVVRARLRMRLWGFNV